jgi:hypothetical protein
MMCIHHRIILGGLRQFGTPRSNEGVCGSHCRRRRRRGEGLTPEILERERPALSPQPPRARYIRRATKRTLLLTQ